MESATSLSLKDPFAVEKAKITNKKRTRGMKTIYSRDLPCRPFALALAIQKYSSDDSTDERRVACRRTHPTLFLKAVGTD